MKSKTFSSEKFEQFYLNTETLKTQSRNKTIFEAEYSCKKEHDLT